MSKTNNTEYYRYIQSRSLIGDIYRKHFPYPRLTRGLKGKTLDLGYGIGDFLRFNRNGIGFEAKYFFYIALKSETLNRKLRQCFFHIQFVKNE